VGQIVAVPGAWIVEFVDGVKKMNGDAGNVPLVVLLFDDIRCLWPVRIFFDLGHKTLLVGQKGECTEYAKIYEEQSKYEHALALGLAAANKSTATLDPKGNRFNHQCRIHGTSVEEKIASCQREMLEI
jgi:hypothetical protein